MMYDSQYLTSVLFFIVCTSLIFAGYLYFLPKKPKRQPLMIQKVCIMRQAELTLTLIMFDGSMVSEPIYDDMTIMEFEEITKRLIEKVYAI